MCPLETLGISTSADLKAKLPAVLSALFPKLDTPKSRLGFGMNTDYLQVKKPVLDGVCNPDVVLALNRFREVTAKVKQLCGDVPLYIKGGKLTRNPPAVNVLRTGIENVLTSEGKVIDYEFGASSLQNMAFAIFDRQLACTVSYNEGHL